ncbi:MAG: tetratricopeptide repeat protein, partial [Betaproteobacteria bacterium]|nr:tetratricopeptide repeat protein [Betaproteobacteria bacterium]
MRLAWQGALDFSALLETASTLEKQQQAPLAAVLYQIWVNKTTSPYVHAGYFNLGAVLGNAGDLAGAEEAYRAAIKLAPNFFQPRVNLGSLLERAGKPDQAIAEWRWVEQHASLAVPFLGEPGLVEGKGSNNWVISGERTTSGKPLLANDPHLGLGTPAIWFYAHLKSPDQNVIGATLPGMPLVVLGHNSHVAWGFTNTGPDVQDLYLEKINPANPLQYQTPDGWQAFETRQESIRVKGKADVVHTVRSTRHGPVLSDAQAAHADIIDTSKFVLALRWAALDEDNHTLVAGIRGSQALTVNDFLEAFKDYHSPMQNVVLADDQGHIAYKALGKVPVRKPGNDLMGMAPAPGWNAQYDWAGWLPMDQTPEDHGAKGWIATANQRITPAGYPHFLGQDWVAPHRMERITQLIEAKPQHD